MATGALPRLPRRWLPRSLRWRLAVWVAGMMLISSAIVLVVVYVNTGRDVQRQIEDDISGDTAQLAQAIAPLRHATVSVVSQTAGVYVANQPYSVTSTVFIVLIGGAPVISNEPSLFASLPISARGSPAQRRLAERELAALRVPRIGYSTLRLPDVGKLRFFERTVKVGAVTVTVGAGEPLASVSRAQHGVARALLLAGALSIALALIASYFAGVRVTAPLRRMSSVAAQVDGGDLRPRMDSSPGSGEEVRQLADTFNHMLDRLSAEFAGQREFIADASHELRTPLTVIRGQLELLAASSAPTAEEVRHVERLAQAEIMRISRLVDDLLLLAQAEHLNFLRAEPIELGSFVPDLWDGLSLTGARRFELGPIPPGRVVADPDRLAQALRNLGRNAIEHTEPETGLVRLEVDVPAPGRVRFAVIDDGTGIPPAERERVFERFHRTDPARVRRAGGAGLGLAIVRAIAEAHGGRVEVADTNGAPGARVELTLPGYR